MPKISIIIPTYNRSNLLTTTIDSVLNQTYKDFELIIIDDGSTDNTKQIVENLKQKDNRIIYEYQNNSGGPASPKNTGIKIAKGEYIAFLDDDDEWFPEKLEKQIKIFEENEDIAIVSCDSVVVSDKNETKVKTSKIDNYNLNKLLIKNSIFTGTVFIKASSIKKKLFDKNLNFLEDWDMWIRILSDNDKIKFIPEILFKYKIGNQNTTKKINLLKKIEAQLYVFNKNIQLYKKYNISHIAMFQVGVKFYLAKEYKQARIYFKKSISFNKLYLISYLGYMITILGKLCNPLINLIIRVNRLINNRNWGNKFK